MNNNNQLKANKTTGNEDFMRELLMYLIPAFSVAWILQIAAALFFRDMYQIILAVSMFAPMFAVFVACNGVKTEATGISLKPQIRKNLKWFAFAWFVPTLLTAAGAVLYFAVFRDKLDLSFGYLVKAYQALGMEVKDGVVQSMTVKDGEPQGMAVAGIAYISIMQCFTHAPLINAIAAVGEEFGWRGYLTPKLTSVFGKKKAMLISGVIWGIWHAPAIWLLGYEYGTGYAGYPITGILMFCIVTVSVGIILSWLYEKTESIWTAAVFHGAFNAAATLPMVFTDGTMKHYLLGPSPNGLIAGIPVFALAAVIFLKETKEEK